MDASLRTPSSTPNAERGFAEKPILAPGSTPAVSPERATGPISLPTVAIIPGYRPGILGRTLEMHLDFYFPTTGWGRTFEARLATGLGDLLTRLDKPVNQVWSAVLTSPSTGQAAPERIVGVVYVDGECSGEEGVARLRCFIVDESARGLGVGRKLMGAAMEFVRETGFRECRLSTMRDLIVARRLYEKEGFKVVGEVWFDGFGKGIMELQYVWHRPGGSVESNLALRP